MFIKDMRILVQIGDRNDNQSHGIGSKAWSSDLIELEQYNDWTRPCIT